MSEMQYSAVSVRQLAAVVERVAPRDPGLWERREPAPSAGGLLLQVSKSRADQLWMVVGMFDRALRQEGMPERARRSAAQLFTRPALQAFWGLAEAGVLRNPHRTAEVGRPLPLASQRIVRDCLGILAGLVVPEKPVALPVVDQPELKSTVDGRSRAALYRGLADLASSGPLERGGIGLTGAERARVLAMVGLVLDAGTRSGELAALRLGDVAADEAAIGVRRRPQKAPPGRIEEIAALAEVHPKTVEAIRYGQVHQRSEAVRQRVLAAIAELEPLPEVEWYPLRDGTRVALRRWLEVREQVVNALPLEGGRSALWVTLRASKAGPPGITLRPESVQKAYAKGVNALNWVMAGQYGWSPLPTTMERLRRGVEAEPLPAESVGDLAGA